MKTYLKPNDQRWEEMIRRKVKTGDGQGSFEEYRPWLNRFSFSSIGRNSVIRGNKIPRLFELFSDLERDYFIILDYSLEILDINEQYPLLDRNLSVDIARELGITHPVYPGSRVPIVMTTDFFLTRTDGTQAVRTIKYAKELEKIRVAEKLQIEQEYFNRKDISDWRIITEDQIDRTKARNISSFRNFFSLERIPGFYGKEKDSIIAEINIFLELAARKKQPLKELFQDFDRVGKPGEGMAIYKHLLSTRKIQIDLSYPLSMEDFIEMKGERLFVTHTESF